MRYVVALVGILLLVGCGKTYSDLEGAFGTSKIGGASRLPADTIVLISQRNPGAESYRGIASIYLSPGAVEIEVSAPFTRPVSIPIQEVGACAMTCFGYSDRHVDLLIPKVGASVMIRESKELLDWCWNTKRPMVPGAVKRDWAYNRVPLPPGAAFAHQFESRAAYDYQTKQSCLGY
ncbi:hypothetical protein B0B52_19695 [Polaromonas sp. A23]|nr:hypothetical protein B0B52_19695 [Polaromonas sp. A23]